MWLMISETLQSTDSEILSVSAFCEIDPSMAATFDQGVFDSLWGRRAALGNPTKEEVQEALKITNNQ